MSVKLFPPILDSKLPAFTGEVIKIPFTMNKTVSLADIAGMSLIIKTATTGRVLRTLECVG
jgi:hypothetical protein